MPSEAWIHVIDDDDARRRLQVLREALDVGRGVLDVMQDIVKQRDVDRLRQLRVRRLAANRLDVRHARRLRLPLDVREEVSIDLDCQHLPFGPRRARQRNDEQPRSGAEIDNDVARAQLHRGDDLRYLEPRDPLRRLEEVERLPGRRRVEDHLPVAPLARDLEQALDRHVLEHPGEAPREVPVEAVAEDPFARRVVRRVAGDQAVEGAPGVEEARVEAGWVMGGGAAPGGRHPGKIDRHLAVARLLPHPEGVLEPERRVEGHHQGGCPGSPDRRRGNGFACRS